MTGMPPSSRSRGWPSTVVAMIATSTAVPRPRVHLPNSPAGTPAGEVPGTDLEQGRDEQVRPTGRGGQRREDASTAQQPCRPDRSGRNRPACRNVMGQRVPDHMQQGGGGTATRIANGRTLAAVSWSPHSSCPAA
jgi:hypothetical protein